MAAFLVILSIATYAGLVHSIPPPQCSANFRWDDCGKTPTPVIYYWKPGSRCEVGIWRGCLPNMNMFKDEYECVTTCVFTVRAADTDFHQIKAEDDEATPIGDYDFSSTTDSDNSTTTNSTESDNSTTIAGSTGGDDNGTTTDISSDKTNTAETKGDNTGDTTTGGTANENSTDSVGTTPGSDTTPPEPVTTAEPE